MTAESEASELPSADEVRGAVDRLVASEVLRASPQLAAFLGFVVEAVLRGESRRIKGYTIAVEALGRAPSFDPQSDSIVRVVAGRLRRALEQYYAEAGADEAIVIDLPRGTYVPIFRRGTTTHAPPVVAVQEQSRPIGSVPVVAAEQKGLVAGVLRRTPAMLGVAAALVIGIAIAGAIGLVPFGSKGESPATMTASVAGPVSQAPRALHAMPVLFIQPFDTIGTPTAPTFAIGRLRSKLSDAMGRFDGVNVVTEVAPSATAGAPADWIEYRFSGSAEYHGDGATTLSFRLVDTADGTLVWSRIFPRLRSEGNPGAAEDAIVREMASAIVEPFGIIWARELSAHAARNPHRACMTDTFEYWRKFNSAQHERVRQCLERMVADDPSFGPAYSGLALVHLRDFYLGIARPGEAPALDLALQSAQHAFELKPQSARAQEALSVIWFTRGEIALAFAAAERAMALNPYDTNVVADYGSRLVAIGQVDKGMAMLSEAAAHSVARPSWFEFYMFLGTYLAGDLAAASRHASLIASDGSPLGLIARAVIAGLGGERDKARQAIDRLVALNPAWRTEPRRQLAKFFPAAEVQDRLLRDLEAAGLVATN
ncbi:MAG: hypothetical protein ACHQAY_26125 [Hyphomicrobiales bacterium]